MGMYTSLRGIVKVKPEYFNLIQNILENGWCREKWQETEEYSFVDEYLKTEGRVSILHFDNLQDPFDEEQDFFQSKFEDGNFYFSTDLKNYRDYSSNMQPIDSFFKNILEKITEEIIVLETTCEDYSTVFQYGFSNEIINQIEILNYTNQDNEPSSFLNKWEGSEEVYEINDIFKEYKEENGLDIFRDKIG